MIREKILVIGASGQIGVELTLALRKIYGNNNVVASDLREENDLLKGTGPYVSLDVMNKEMLHVQVIRQNITQIIYWQPYFLPPAKKILTLPGASICKAC
jgi:nucleoside-diphosphate-sugar epimerase